MNDLSHQQAQNLLQAGEALSVEQGTALRAHLGTCGACRDYSDFDAYMKSALPGLMPSWSLSDAEIRLKSAVIRAKLRTRRIGTAVSSGSRSLAWVAICAFLVISLGWSLYAASRLPLAGIIPQSSRDLLVVGEESGYVTGCGPREVASTVLEFFEAYNGGDQATLAGLFAQNPEWYFDSLTGRGLGQDDLTFRTSRRDELLAYVAERHTQHEHFELLAIGVLPSEHGGSDFGLVFRRQADDLQPASDGLPRMATGRGAVNCSRGEIFVWGGGIAPASEDPNAYFQSIVWCTSSFTLSELPDAVIVCARE